ncbi:MAG: GNAT family N-acetyltransferase, partial [Anaerolineales bacterium]|nr:GNAT family N-acetyltransferase [Anaerolineales bacterium]
NGFEPPGHFYLSVAVDPAARGQGIGGRLYAALTAAARHMAAARLVARVRDDEPDSLAFAQRRGFALHHHLFTSVLDLQAFDERPFAHLPAAVAAAGMRLTTLAAEGDTPAARRQLYDLNHTTHLDNPAADGTFPDFDSFNEMFNTASWFRPEAQFLAFDGDRAVGLAAVGYFAHTNSLYHFMTGVDRAYRGRQIAAALKLRTIQYGRALGADYMRTDNDSRNAAMLAINRRFGYRPRGGSYWLHKEPVDETV